MEKYTKSTYYSKGYYEKITKIAFDPLSEVKLELYKRKGESKSLKLFGMEFFKKTFDEDIYYYNGDKMTLKEITASLYNHMTTFDGCKLYHQARVILYFTNDSPIYSYFNTNDEAKEYIDDIKEKCKECGNLLF